MVIFRGNRIEGNHIGKEKAEMLKIYGYVLTKALNVRTLMRTR